VDVETLHKKNCINIVAEMFVRYHVGRVFFFVATHYITITEAGEFNRPYLTRGGEGNCVWVPGPIGKSGQCVPAVETYR
jgi:hypothetical protein